MKRKHHRGQRHYSGKELLERRKAERKEREKRLVKKEKEDKFYMIHQTLPYFWI